MENTPHLLLYTANLIFILTNLYGYLIKNFYTPNPYRENFHTLFPGQKLVALLYLTQLFEIPYLLMIGQPEALLYVNTFSLLIFPSLMVVISESYFFLRKRSTRSQLLFFLPVLLIPLYLLAIAVGAPPLYPCAQTTTIGIVLPFTLWYFYRIVRIQQKIRLNIRLWNEKNYSDPIDFPVHFAQRIEWLPLTISLSMLVCFIANDAWVKFGRDILFSFVNVWFLIYTLNPHRQNNLRQQLSIKQEEPNDNNAKYRLSQERSQALQTLILETLLKNELFRENHLSIDTLSRKLHTNKNYISEALSRSPYSSFYNIVNQLRVEYAATLLSTQPEMKMEEVATTSGFSSGSLFSRIFKQHKGIAPSQFISQHHTKHPPTN